MDQSKRIMIIRESITKIAKILSDNKVLVTQSGVKAYVKYDEKTMKPTRVNLPMIPDDATPELIDAVQGFLDAEISKVLYSDPECALRAHYEQMDSIFSPIESLFCEGEMMAAFPGARKNLDFMHQTFVDRFIEPKLKEALANGAGEQELFQVLAIPALRAWGGQKFFQDYMSDKWSLIAGIQKELDPIAKQIGTMKSPKDVYKISQDIRRVVMGEPPEGGGSGHNPFGDKSSGGAAGGGKAAGGSGGSSKGGPGEIAGSLDDEEEEGAGEEEGEEEGGSPSPFDEEEEVPEEADEGDEGEDEEETDRPDPSDIEPSKSDVGSDRYVDQTASPDMTEDQNVSQSEYGGKAIMKNFDWDKVQDVGTEFGQFVTDLCSKEMLDEPYTVYTREWDQIEAPQIPKSFDVKWMHEIEKAIDGMVGPVARNLERAFTARNKSLWQQGQTKGRMSSNNLYRLTAGDDHIFKKKIEHKTRDIAVSLVIDCSGSMHGSKIFTAMCSAWVMSDVLQRLNISHEIIGFTTGDIGNPKAKELMKEYENECRATGEWDKWDRAEVIRMPVFKSFQERFGIEQRKRMASYPKIYGALANNIDGESVQYAYERLLKEASKGKPKGKMMIVFSDGQPAAGVNSRKLNSHLKQVVNRIEASGTNIVGVGIMSNSVQSFYRKNVVLNNVADLPGIVLKQLRDALLAS